MYKFLIIINCTKKLTFIAKEVNLYRTSTVLRGALNKVLYGEAPRQGSTPHPLMYHSIESFYSQMAPLSHIQFKTLHSV